MFTEPQLFHNSVPFLALFFEIKIASLYHSQILISPDMYCIFIIL